MLRSAESRTAYRLYALVVCLGFAANAFAVVHATSTAITGQAPSANTLPGQNVTFTATVTDTISNTHGTPTGTVDFYNNAASTCPGNLDPSFLGTGNLPANAPGTTAQTT